MSTVAVALQRCLFDSQPPTDKSGATSTTTVSEEKTTVVGRSEEVGARWSIRAPTRRVCGSSPVGDAARLSCTRGRGCAQRELGFRWCGASLARQRPRCRQERSRASSQTPGSRRTSACSWRAPSAYSPPCCGSCSPRRRRCVRYALVVSSLHTGCQTNCARFLNLKALYVFNQFYCIQQL